MLPLYEICAINPESPWTPGEALALVDGIFRTQRRAIEIARGQHRPVMIWIMTDVDRFKRIGVKPGERRWIRYYSADAPLVTAANERTIRHLASQEDVVRRAQISSSVKSTLETVADMAESAEEPSIAFRVRAIAAEMAPVVSARREEVASAEAALERRHWPRQAREEPTIRVLIDGAN